jgi:transcriptional regulator with XRE-family HTH domain
MPSAKSPELVALGHAIRQVRDERSLSQEDLAHRSDLDRSYMGGVERGERNVSFINLGKIAAALGLKASELLARGEQIERSRRR